MLIIALGIKSIRFRIRVAGEGQAGVAIWTQEKGAASSFVRVFEEVERRLRDAGLVPSIAVAM